MKNSYMLRLYDIYNSGVIDSTSNGSGNPSNYNSGASNITTTTIECNIDMTSFFFGLLAGIGLMLIFIGIYKIIEYFAEKDEDKSKIEEEHK